MKRLKDFYCPNPKKEVEDRFGKDLKAYAIEKGLDYSELLEEEAIRNLYNYKFIFNI